KILEVCNCDETDIEELVGIISSDALLSARLMQIMSSAWVNLNKEIQSVESAIIYLGIESIKNLVLSISVVQVFSSEKILRQFNMNAFWHHSFRCALLAKKIARRSGLASHDEAFLAGLMHDIGKLVLMVNYPLDYQEILEKASSDHDLEEREKRHFNFTHAQVGGWLCQKWNFSPMISDAVLYVNDSIDRARYALFPLVKIINAVNRLCSPETLESLDHDQITDLVSIDQSELDPLMTQVACEVEAMADSLGLKPHGQPDGFRSPALYRLAASGSKADDIALELIQDSLKSRVKEHALIYGTIETLLQAEDLPALLNALDVGLKIIVRVSTIFFFLHDSDSNMLTGFCNDREKISRIINSIAISFDNKESLLVNAIISRIPLNSLNVRDQGRLAIPDAQIIRLLGCEAMFCLPMYLPDKPVGVVVMGVDTDIAPDLIKNTEMLSMLARLAAFSIDHRQYRSGHGNFVKRERAEAASDSIRKVIHEINNPLLIITSYLKRLSLKLPERHPAQKELSVIEEEIDRIGGLVKELSSISKPPVRQFEWVDLSGLFKNILDMVKKSILVPKGIEADLSVEPGFPKVKTDKNALKQILINLLKNAYEAMSKGGSIHISLKKVPGSVKIMIDERKRTTGKVEIIFRDNGPGISDEIMKRLFEPYNSSKKGNNSGLGLSIVNAIVKDINGTIECNTNKNFGTEFKIILPISSSPKVLKEQDSPTSQISD
ncbi:MAG: HDOD domain-containing protein, partial [Desulfamplus sp.]|nr:HDOD domain-containing protein [Desulfamplus sp.]